MRPKILDKGDETFVVTYTPCDAGRYTINIKYGGDPVPLSPFYVMSTATGDASQVKILGMQICFSLFLFLAKIK